MSESVPNIQCPIDLFPKQDSKVQELTQRINEAKRIQQKAELAHALLAEVEVLLRCSAYDEGNVNCVNCQAVSGVLRRTATLILKTEKALDPWARQIRARPRPSLQHVAVVRRGAVEKFQFLQEQFPEGKVIWDRRTRERREVLQGVGVERRRDERRRPPPVTWGVSDFLIVQLTDGPPISGHQVPFQGDGMGPKESR